MSNHLKSILRWTLFVAIAVAGSACSAAGVSSSAVQQGILQLDNGIVKIKDQTGNLQPLAGDSTFELIGTVESVDPWKVSGRALQRNEATQIAQGIQVGDLVRVRGAVLQDGSWLAYSIEPAKQETNQTVTIIGQVTSTNPWVVNGLPLNVTSDTVVNGDIQVGTLARVEILLQEDGTWEVLSISPLGDLPTISGCATVVATVASVNGNQIQFVGWPAPVTVQTAPAADNATNDNSTEENEDENGVDLATLKPGQQVTAVVCSQNGQLVITTLNTLGDENDDNNESQGGEKVLICHKPAKKGGHTISVSSSAVPAHLGHGDKLGKCP
jgi:hypothetical protein